MLAFLWPAATAATNVQWCILSKNRPQNEVFFFPMKLEKEWTSLLWLINKIFPNLSKNVSFLCALRRGILALDKIFVDLFLCYSIQFILYSKILIHYSHYHYRFNKNFVAVSSIIFVCPRFCCDMPVVLRADSIEE